jgi:Uma2 family endonuclease
VAIASRLMTAEELLQLPDDDYRYELVRGVLKRMPPPDFEHGREAAIVSSRLRVFADDHGLGEVVADSGFRVEHAPDTVRGPDVAFVAAARVPPPEQRSSYFPGAPDLAVEIVSPSNRAAEIRRKVQEYFAGGARLVWVVDRRPRTVSVHRSDGSVTVLAEGDTLSGEDVLPGFTLRVSVIFA